MTVRCRTCRTKAERTTSGKGEAALKADLAAWADAGWMWIPVEDSLLFYCPKHRENGTELLRMRVERLGEAALLR